MSKQPGAIRNLLEHIKAIATASELTIEEVADVLDSYAATMNRDDDTPAEPQALLPMPKRLQ